MMKLHCCHNLLQLQGTICFDSASQRLRPTVPTFFWLSYTDQSNNTQIMRTENNNDSVTIINNNNNNIAIIFMINRSNWPFLDVVRWKYIMKERMSFT